MNLDRVRWKGEATYRILSYYFSVRWNVAGVEEVLNRVLSPFAVPSDPDEDPSPPIPGLPSRYSIVRRWSEPEPFRLLYGGLGGPDTEMVRGRELGFILGTFLWNLNMHVLRRSGDFLLVHAGSVSTPAGDGVLLPAQSGSGKTTLTAGLVRAGFQYLSDEAGAIDPVTRMLYPFRRALSLKQGHTTVFPDLCPNGDGAWMNGTWPVPAEELRPGSAGGPCPIRFIIGPTYRAGSPTELTPVTRAEGVMLLLTNAFNLTVYRSRGLTLAADVARHAQSFRLVTGDVQEAVDAITELTTGRRRVAEQPA